jgi:FlaA1/EpsC-like NDP-sugar epimerase
MLKRIRDVFSGMPRALKRVLLIGFDVVALLIVMWASFQLRLGGSFAPSLPQLLLMLLAPVLAIPIFIRMGLYRAVIRYLPERAIWTIVQAMALATLSWVAALFLAEATRLAVFPRSVPLFYLVFGTAAIAGSRFLAKAVLWLPERLLGPEGGVVIYGAGTAGTQLAAALRSHGRNFVAAFLDDDSKLWGRDVAGYRVYPPSRLGDLVRNRGVREVILSIPSANATQRSEIVAALSRQPVKIRTLPAIADLVSGKYLISQLREIDIDDLLGRETAPGEPQLFTSLLGGRTILVSGAGGSIGGELTRLIQRWQPKKLILLEANEHALYQIDRQLAQQDGAPVRPVLGSIGDEALLRRLFAEEAVDVVFHAAAHKHVPLVEANALEGVRNNVFGTQALVAAAVAAGVSHFVLISSDKAVRPKSVMGATKRWAELIVRHYGSTADGRERRFCSVRFGNVLGSNGSVVPLFREQIAAGGPVTLTDTRMTRYFMSLHEAAELIVEAGALSRGGDIFLLEMGEPVKIAELAENMIRLAGLSLRSPENPTGDIAIAETGARPGEKLTEELFFDPANAERTEHPKILRSPPAARHTDDLPEALSALKRALDQGDEAEVRRVLFGLVEN